MAIGLKGDVVDELLRGTASGVVVNEVNEIKTLLSKWMQEFKQSGEIASHFKPDSAAVSQYTRKQQAAKLATIMDEITKSQSLGGE